jgi:hypothetical protein
MSVARKMHLAAYLKTGPTASYVSAWRHPSAPLHEIWDAERCEHLARLLEHARFDAGFFADGLGLPDIYKNSYADFVGRGGQMSLIDPMAVLPLMARVTKHLVDLRVDLDAQPLVELRFLWELYQSSVDNYVVRAVDPDQAPASEPRSPMRRPRDP